MLNQSASENFLDSSTHPWDTGSHQLWSLLDLLKAYAHIYSQISNNLGELSRESEHLTDDPHIQKRARAAIVQTLGCIRDAVAQVSLQSVLDRIDRVVEKLNDPLEPINLPIEMRVLQETFEDAIRPMQFLYLPPVLATAYSAPLSSWGNTCNAFPSTREHIRGMSRAYAFGLYTASVYHGMAVAQSGLYALADHMGVTFNYPIELAEWQTVIERIETKAKRLRDLPRSADKDVQLQFYSEAAAQFRYFKDAWRNHTAHMRTVYDEHGAFSVISHVREFMEKLSTHIAESPSLS